MRYITPEHCITSRLAGRPAPNWAATFLVCRDYPGSQQALATFENVRPVRYRLLYNMTHAEFEPLVFEADVAGRTIAIVTRVVWGGPQMAILVEELAALSVKFLLSYGIAGSIDPALPKGSLIVAASALPTDGTSKAYGVSEIQRAETGLVEAALASAARTGCEMQPVCAATIDALYRETAEQIDRFARQGAQVINMETTPLYAAASACGVRSLWCGYVSDCLVEGNWDDWYADLGNAAEETISACHALLCDDISTNSTCDDPPAET